MKKVILAIFIAITLAVIGNVISNNLKEEAKAEQELQSFASKEISPTSRMPFEKAASDKLVAYVDVGLDEFHYIWYNYWSTPFKDFSESKITSGEFMLQLLTGTMEYKELTDYLANAPADDIAKADEEYVIVLYDNLYESINLRLQIIEVMTLWLTDKNSSVAERSESLERALKDILDLYDRSAVTLEKVEEMMFNLKNN